MCVYGQCVGVSRQTNLVTSLIFLVNVSRVACWCFLGSTREFQGQLFNQWRFPFVSRTFELTASFSSLQHTDRVSNKPTSYFIPFNYVLHTLIKNGPSKHRKIPPLFETALVLPQSCQKAKLVTRPGTCIHQLRTRKPSVDTNPRREMR